MNKPIRVLIIEDSEDDAALLVRELHRGGYDPVFERIDTPEALASALDKELWNLIISDYSMPRFDGLTALRMVKESGLDIPFLLVSGTIGEETAVAAIKAGANDFLLKGQLGRLIPAINRELRETDVRRQQERIQRSLQESEERFRLLAEGVNDYAIFALDTQGCVATWNDGAARIKGYAAGEILGKHFSILYTKNDIAEGKPERELEIARSEGKFEGEGWRVRKDGSHFWANVTILPMWDREGQLCGYSKVTRDDTESIQLSGQVYTFFELSIDMLCVAGFDGYFKRLNPSWEKVLGFSPEELMATPWLDFVHPDDREATLQAGSNLSDGDDVLSFENRYRCKDGSYRWIHWNASPYPDRQLIFAVGRDVTTRKQADETVRLQTERLRVQTSLLELAHDAILVRDMQSAITFWNRGAELTYGSTKEEAMGQTTHSLLKTQFTIPLEQINQTLVEHGRWEGELIHTRPDGLQVVVESRQALLRDESGRPLAIMEINRNITRTKQAEADLEKQQFLVSIVTTQKDIAMAEPSLKTVMNLVTDRTLALTNADAAAVELEEGGEIVYRAASGSLVDHVGLHFKVEGNLPEVCFRTGELLRSDDTATDPRCDQAACLRLNIRSMVVVPIYQDRAVIGVLQAMAATPQAFNEQDIQTLRLMAGLISAAVATVAAFEAKQILEHDRAAALADLRASENVLKRQSQELVRSNTDLEQFAYVASHDLQEPLRMIGSYLELLDREYSEHLDDDAREYIAYAVDGAVRMKCLINDLLSFSRVGTQGKPMHPTVVGSLLTDVLSDLQVLIDETGSVITSDPLPTVSADRSQLRLVLQNLIGNAIKFRGEEAPRVHFSATAVDGEWRFAVQDNGIGIKPKQAERIFVIFQRLHNKDTYPGTGIGLTTCKRVVERHGGRIWVESEPGSGSTFFFTLPDAAADGPAAMPAFVSTNM